MLHTYKELYLGLPFHHHLAIGAAFSKVCATKRWFHSRVCQESLEVEVCVCVCMCVCGGIHVTTPTKQKVYWRVFCFCFALCINMKNPAQFCDHMSQLYVLSEFLTLRGIMVV